MNKIRLILIFTLSSFISVTAFEVYQMTLADYNVGLALFAFQCVMLFVLHYVYPSIDQLLGRFFPLIVETENEDTLGQTYRKQPLALTALGLGSCFRFGLMLPFLQTMDNSLLFIVFYALGKLVSVPLAIRFFNDRIVNRKMYIIGILLTSLGAIAFTVSPINPQQFFNGNWILLVAAVCKLLLEVYDTIQSRFIQTTTISHKRTVSVQKTEQIKAIYTILFGFFIGIYFLSHHSLNDSLPNTRQLTGIMWIGVVVSLTATLAIRLTNELSHTVTQPIQSSRPLIAFIPYVITYLHQGGDSSELIYKTLCMIVILTGVLVCLANGTPLRDQESTGPINAQGNWLQAS